MFVKNLFICTLFCGAIFTEGKSNKKSLTTKHKATVFPIVPASKKRKVPILKTKVALSNEHLLPKLDLINREKRYDKKYLAEYKKMIRSLLPETEMYTDFNSREFLVLPYETLTDKSLYSEKKGKLPTCSAKDEKNWRKVKVLQLEKKNSVTLKENSNTGVRVVEKLMEGQRHYDKEMNFFRHAHHGSNKYFPALICSSKPRDGKNSRYSIITDFVDGEKSHVMAAKATEDQLRFMVAQLFNSIVELHKVGFIHCDLSPANVMVTKQFEVKLIDFGMAMPVGQATGYRGSFYTRAPELHAMSPGKIDVAIDWWAFGCIVSMWYFYHFNPEMLKDTSVSYRFTPMKLSKKKFYAGIFPKEFAPELRKFLSLFLTIDPERRTFSTARLQNAIRNHEYFKGFDWSIAEKY